MPKRCSQKSWLRHAARSEPIRNADLSSSEGLAEQLQEATLVLLRNSASWTHVCASSQKVKGRENAEIIFQEFSVSVRAAWRSYAQHVEYGCATLRDWKFSLMLMVKSGNGKL
ncbi:MAG: DUF1517 domain-containing protein [Hormoscilla sp. GM7CHS1pb]|nr:DUF1517 domain-containing protein [Hormoscilla sp. GM7CHS1pb]